MFIKYSFTELDQNRIFVIFPLQIYHSYYTSIVYAILCSDYLWPNARYASLYQHSVKTRSKLFLVSFRNSRISFSANVFFTLTIMCLLTLSTFITRYVFRTSTGLHFTKVFAEPKNKNLS